ncbi:MAG: hypothetical protein IPJ51_25200 [Saprospiraceae bacterium]|nr:hypothetical protein [Saprospiraceae bacterium]
MNKKKCIIIVHGTFASTKEGWASLEGGFLAKIHKALYELTGKLYYLYAFEWSGTNSLYARQSASVRLMEMLKRLGETHESIHLIGHSHGGTIIQYALENHTYLKSKNTWKSIVKSWTTVGTPFYSFKGINKYINPRHLYSLAFWTSFLLIGIFCFFLGHNTFQNILKLVQNQFWYLAIATFILAGLINQIFEALTFNSSLNHTFQNYGSKWLGIYSRYDEAILGLKNSKDISIKLSKREFPSDGLSNHLLFFTRLIFNIIYDYTARILISKFLTSKFKNYFTGIDRNYFLINKVNFNPNNKEPFFIPKEIDENILKEIIADNQSKVGFFRNSFNSENNNLFKTIIDSNDLNKPKLVHSAYFDQNEIIKFILEHIMINEEIPINETDWMKKFRQWNNSR